MAEGDLSSVEREGAGRGWKPEMGSLHNLSFFFFIRKTHVNSNLKARSDFLIVLSARSSLDLDAGLWEPTAWSFGFSRDLLCHSAGTGHRQLVCFGCSHGSNDKNKIRILS